VVRSRFFVGVSLLTAVSLAVSSVVTARPLLPVLSAKAAKSPSIYRIDDRREKRQRKKPEKRQRKKIDWRRHYDDRQSRQHRKRPSKREYRGPVRHHDNRGRSLPRKRVVVVKPVRPGPRHVAPPNRRHRYRNVWVVRRHGHWYRGYGHHYHDEDAYRWLAFTAISLSILSLLSVAQQRAQEQAQIDAATAPVGSTIDWNDANASGSVSVLREGRSSNEQPCREFQQTVTIGGRSEQAYGIACMQPDGAWRIVNTQ
jgi:hypothetical protein